MEDSGVHAEDTEVTDDKMILEFRSAVEDASNADKEEYLQMMVSLGAMSRNNAVSEIYSPPRVSALARRMGLRKGFALDLTVVDPDDGRPWDFAIPAERDKALQMVKEERPVLLITDVHSIFEPTEV